MAKIQIGDIILVDPVCNKGFVQAGKVVGYEQNSSKYGYTYWVVRYLFKPDAFGREVVHISDDEILEHKIVNTMNIDSLRVLYG